MRSFFYFTVLLFLTCILSAGQALALSVDHMRFGTHPDKTRLVLDMSELSDFRVFTLADPYRMVIDLPDFEWQAPPIDGFGASGITNVRYGRLEPGISRIVFDLARPVGVRAAFTLPGQGGKADRLVVDFGPVSDAVFERSKNRIYGTLSLDEIRARDTRPYRTAGMSAVAPPLPKTKVKKPLIVIDPGHGGVDPGAVGANNTYEKHVTLALARELRTQLEKSGHYRVLLTRERDTFIKLSDRVRFARRHDADLFISLHADSIDKPNVHGASVYTLSEKASDAQTARLAARENRADLIAGIDLSHEDDDVANILVDLAMRDTMNQSKFFAGLLVDTLKDGRVRVLKKPHRHAGFAVLKAPDIPSLLVEAGFMSNPEEAAKLSSSVYRRNIARALKRGIDAYFEQVRKNQRI